MNEYQFLPKGLDGENVNPNDVINPEPKIEDSDYFRMNE
jgi:hypothetical protein